MNRKIEPAVLAWKEDTPYSGKYQDTYFNTINGIEESHFVFLQNNELITRWKNTRKAVFKIAETGFGTGLNFLNTWREWLTLPKDSRPQLHYYSVEKHPVLRSDLERIYASWPQFMPQARQLLNVYPEFFCPGNFSHAFENRKFTLTLYFGDVLEGIENLEPEDGVDCWFLDGFTPSRNPDMWTKPLFDLMVAKSSYNATFSTFTSAGSIRRSLQKAGFEIQKVPGFGKKREMLRGFIER